MDIVLGIVIAYLLGALSTAIIVSKVLRLPDPRHTGSGNPGATNVLRYGGKKAAIITLIGDVGKGWLPVFVAAQLGIFPTWALGLIGLAAFLGHVFPVYYGFRGGKGVATALGVLLALNPLVGGITLLTWLLVAAIWRYSSLAALVAATLAPVYFVFLEPDFWVALIVAAMAIVLFIRHDSNIRQLMRGEEGKIGHKGGETESGESPRDGG